MFCVYIIHKFGIDYAQSHCMIMGWEMNREKDWHYGRPRNILTVTLSVFCRKLKCKKVRKAFESRKTDIVIYIAIGLCKENKNSGFTLYNNSCNFSRFFWTRNDAIAIHCRSCWRSGKFKLHVLHGGILGLRQTYYDHNIQSVLALIC